MTVPCFQFWRLRVIENYGGETTKIDAISFLGRSGGNPISTGGEAIANAGDASGAFSGGSAWVVGTGVTSHYYALACAANVSDEDTFVIDSATFAIQQSLNIDPADIATYSVKFSPDGNYLAVYATGVIPSPGVPSQRVFVLETTGWTTVFSDSQSGGGTGYQSLAWSADSRYLAAIGDGSSELFVYDSQSAWADVYSGTVGIPYGVQLHWSPSGSHLAVANADLDPLVVFDTSDWSTETISTPSKTSNDYFTGVQFSADGSKLYASLFVTSGDAKFLTINTATWTESSSHTFLGSQTTFFPLGIYISPDENYVAIGDANTNTGVRLFSFPSMSEVTLSSFTATAPTYSTPAVAWKSDSSEFLFAGQTAQLFSVDVATATIAEVSSVNSVVSTVYSIDATTVPPAPPGGAAIGYKFALPVTPSHIEITASGTSRPKTGVIEYSGDGRTWYPLQTIGFD